MSKVYSVSGGVIRGYQILKVTNCFYKIKNGTYEDKLTKEGILLHSRLGGITTVTTDILKAAEAAQSQINIIDEYLVRKYVDLQKAENELKEFLSKHEAIGD